MKNQQEQDRLLQASLLRNMELEAVVACLQMEKITLESENINLQSEHPRLESEHSFLELEKSRLESEKSHLENLVLKMDH